MRIIGGLHRSRKILGPEGALTTRPITDRVKQSLFDRLRVRGYVDSGTAIDIFCGTGSLGLEALSRGVDHCTFIERDRSVRGLLEKNIASLKLADQALVLAIDAVAGGGGSSGEAWIQRLPRQPVSLIFCDPPYAMTQDPQDMARLCEMMSLIAPIAEPDALLMLRTEEYTPAPALDAWTGPESHKHGSMQVHLYIRA